MSNKILVVDDLKFNRILLKNLLEGDYEIIEAENGQEALDIIADEKDNICAVMLDLSMPVMSGTEFLKIANKNNYIDLFPILVVTAEQEMDMVQECFDYGISDFIRKPVNTEFVKSRVDRLVQLYRDKNRFKQQAERSTSTVTNQYKMLQSQSTKLKETNDKIMRLFGTVVEYRNLEAGNHIIRIREYTKVLAQYIANDYPEYGLTPQIIDIMGTVSMLHDLGKIMISDSILLKPGKLANEEFEIMKSHSIHGYDIVGSAVDAWDEEYLRLGKEITRWHHEKYDGNGYPDKLVGEDIPISAQIVSLADCYESLTTDSAYREAYSLDEAYHMIRKGDCGVFSPKLLIAFAQAQEEFERIAKELKDSLADDEIDVIDEE